MKAEFQMDTVQMATDISNEILKVIKLHLFEKQDDDLIYSVEELAKYLRVSSKWVYAHTYELPHFKLGGLLRFRKKDIDRTVNQLALIESLKKS